MVSAARISRNKLNVAAYIGAGIISPDGMPLSGVVALTNLAGDGMADTAGNRLVGTFVNDNPALSLRQIAARKGMLFGTSTQSPALMSAAGPSGFATRLDWLAANTDLFVPGYVMMGDVFNPSLGTFAMSGVTAFLDDARARGKMVRGHVIGFYGKRDIGTWVDTYLQANPDQWQAVMAARIDALCAVLTNYRDIITNADVVNELFGVGSTNPGGWRTSPWNTAAAALAGRNAATATLTDYLAPVLFAIARVREKLPGVPLYWCQDLTEQLGNTPFHNHANNVLAGITAAIQAGAVVEGYAQQAHLEIRLAFSGPRLRTFLSGLAALGLKIIVSEIDIRTGYGDGIVNAYGVIDTPPPSAYTAAELQRIQSEKRKQYLDIALPFVRSTGGNQLIEWTLDNGYNSWTEASGQPPGEMPCAFSAAFQPTPQLAAMRNALLEC